MYKLSRNSKKHLSGVRPEIKEIVKRALERSENDFGIPEYGGLRTAQEQNNLYHKRPPVTHIDGFRIKSYHQTGNAFDVFMIGEDGKACWDCFKLYERFAKMIKKIFAEMKDEGVFKENETLSWGGDWKTRFGKRRDLCHFEIR